MTIMTGAHVSLEYTLRLDDHSVVDSNVGQEPLTYTQGNHQLIPGLERALEGMATGERKHVTVAPVDGYGVIDPEAFQEVEKGMIPADSQMVGTQLQGTTPDGQQVFPRVSEIKADTIVLDFNHPLAGKTLHFEVKILGVSGGPGAVSH